MYFGTLFPAPEWLSGEDEKTYNKFKRAILREIKQSGLRMNSMLATHVQDVLMAHVYVGMAERAVFSPKNGQKPGAPVRPSAAQLESLARQRENLRNSLRDLREFLAASCGGAVCVTPPPAPSDTTDRTDTTDKTNTTDAVEAADETGAVEAAGPATRPTAGAPPAPAKPAPAQPAPPAPPAPNPPSRPASLTARG